jgi:hypothetical protein
MAKKVNMTVDLREGILTGKVTPAEFLRMLEDEPSYELWREGDKFEIRIKKDGFTKIYIHPCPHCEMDYDVGAAFIRRVEQVTGG